MIKEIKDHPGYFVSDSGKVYCNLGKGNRRGGKTVPLYEIAPRYTKGGYGRICARNVVTGKRDDLYIHRLVAMNFLDPVPGKNHVNHKNCNRHDCRASNLEWVNEKENNAQTMRLGHMVRDELGRFKSNFDCKEAIG